MPKQIIPLLFHVMARPTGAKGRYADEIMQILAEEEIKHKNILIWYRINKFNKRI